MTRLGTPGQWYRIGYVSGVMSTAFQPECVAVSSLGRRITVGEIMSLVDGICAVQPYARLIDVTLQAMGVSGR